VLPLTLVMTARPALLSRHPGWDADSDALAGALLQRMAAIPPELRELIVARAEGNPYYMEELVRHLIDEGAIVADGAGWRVHGERL
jgi:predicted ATPase